MAVFLVCAAVILYLVCYRAVKFDCFMAHKSAADLSVKACVILTLTLPDRMKPHST